MLFFDHLLYHGIKAITMMSLPPSMIIETPDTGLEHVQQEKITNVYDLHNL